MKDIFKRAVTAAFAALVSLGGIPCAAYASAADLTWVRLAGETRYDTMREITQTQFPSCERAVIASGEKFPDALAASSLAGALRCPVLITQAGELTKQTGDELKRLGVKSAYIVGGEGSVSSAAQQAITGMGIKVSRIAGTDRASTSVAVLDQLNALKEDRTISDYSDYVIVATGTSFADALSISPYAYRDSAPIVLVSSPTDLGERALGAIAKYDTLRKVLIVGGELSVAKDVESQISKLGRTFSVERLGGANRYQTSTAIADWEIQRGLTWDIPCVACGMNYPDALCGASLCGETGSPILLIDDLSNSTWPYLNEHSSLAQAAFVFGGLSSTPLIWSADAKLNEQLDALVPSFGSGVDGLRRAYDQIASMDYAEGELDGEGTWWEWSVPYAKDLLRSGTGNSYHYASLMTWVARRLGYDARAYAGKVHTESGEMRSAGWCELHLDGKVCLIDCERHRAQSDQNFFMVTYADAPTAYYDLNGVRLT